jgi:hypothetical protein
MLETNDTEIINEYYKLKEEQLTPIKWTIYNIKNKNWRIWKWVILYVEDVRK